MLQIMDLSKFYPHNNVLFVPLLKYKDWFIFKYFQGAIFVNLMKTLVEYLWILVFYSKFARRYV